MLRIGQRIQNHIFSLHRESVEFVLHLSDDMQGRWQGSNEYFKL